MIVREEVLSLRRHLLYGYLVELQEHANLMAAVPCKCEKYGRKKEKRFTLIGLKIGVDRLQNTLYPSEKCTKMKFKNLMELLFKVGLVGHAVKFT